MSITEAVPSLTPNQTQALILLMAEARELTNNEMRDLAGFALTGGDNARLVSLGLVETDKTHRPYSHQLTDKGWRIVREMSAGAPPKRASSALKSLLVLLANVHRSLDRLQVSQGEFFKQAPAMGQTTSEALDVPSVDRLLDGQLGGDVGGDVDVEAAIRAAYGDLATARGEWIGFADLREHLGGLDRVTVDEALRAMLRHQGVRIIPVANSKALQPRDRAAALRIGDEDNHALSIDTP
jgi:hypothetical protein